MELAGTAEIPLCDYDELYHTHGRHVRTPVTTLFFTESNLVRLNERIGEDTGRWLGQEVRVVPNNEFFAYLEQTLQEAPNARDASCVVRALNDLIVEHEVPVQYYSLRRRALFAKWFIAKDRPLVISHPIETHGRHRLEAASHVGRVLRDPDRRRWAEFQQTQRSQPGPIPELFADFL